MQDLDISTYPISTLITLAVLSLLPFAFMIMTSFVKISVVFSILRNALGLGSVPSGMIISALATVLTLHVMQPVAHNILEATRSVWQGHDSQKELSIEDWVQLFKQGKEPLVSFLTKHAHPEERALFTDLARRSAHPDTRADIRSDDFLVVLPAFMISELTEAFQIGFLIFLPFLVLDMIVANVLLSLGMHMLSPTVISLPLKLLLFVVVNGWYVLARALMLSY